MNIYTQYYIISYIITTKLFKMTNEDLDNNKYGLNATVT